MDFPPQIPIPSVSSLPRGHERLLLVEDEAAVAETTAQMLRCLGYTVVTATLPSQALAVLAGSEQPFDLVISDITMPEMNGYELIDQIHRHHGPMPVLFVTGYDFSANDGSTSAPLLQKPLSLMRLAEGVRRALQWVPDGPVARASVS